MITFILNNCTVILLLLLLLGFMPPPPALVRWSDQIDRGKAIQTDFRSNISVFEHMEGSSTLRSALAQLFFDQTLRSMHQNSTVSQLLSEIQPSMSRAAKSSAQLTSNVTTAVLDCAIFSTKELSLARLDHADKDDLSALMIPRDEVERCIENLRAAGASVSRFRDFIPKNITVKVDQLHNILLTEKHQPFGNLLIEPHDNMPRLKAATAQILKDMLQVEESLAAVVKNLTVTRDLFAGVHRALNAGSNSIRPSLERAKDNLCSYAVKCELLPGMIVKKEQRSKQG